MAQGIVIFLLAVALISITAQLAAARSAARYQATLLKYLSAIGSTTLRELFRTRRLLAEQEHRRIMRDAREARIRLHVNSSDALNRIDIARVTDGQAEQLRREHSARHASRIRRWRRCGAP